MGMPLTQKQQEAIPILKKFNEVMLAGGSRAGKTYLIIYMFLYRAIQCPCRHLVVRRYGRDVKEAIWYDTLPKVLSNEFPPGFSEACEFNNKHLFIRVPNTEGSFSEIWFGGLDAGRSTERILGKEYAGIFINEASEFMYETVNTVATRLAEKTKVKNVLIYDMNPPGRTHWSYHKFIEHKEPVSRQDLKTENGFFRMNPQDNLDNLPKSYLDFLEDLPPKAKQRFLEGEFTDESEDAIWKSAWVYANKSKYKNFEELKAGEQLTQVAIGVDPAISATDHSDLTGIVVVARDVGGHYHVIKDGSIRATPERWAQRVISFADLYKVNYVVIETNQGGDMCRQTLKNAGYTGKVVDVRASVGKHARAEPIAVLYELGKVHHLNTIDLLALEEEMVSYVPDLVKKSPDRMDALVWAITQMNEGGRRAQQLRELDNKFGRSYRG